MDHRDVQPGWPVFDLNGDQIGEVDNVGADYLHVQGGLLFHKDYYVPQSAITRIDAQSVHLSVPKDRIDDLHWDRPPLEQPATTQPAGDLGATDMGRYTESGTESPAFREGMADFARGTGPGAPLYPETVAGAPAPHSPAEAAERGWGLVRPGWIVYGSGGEKIGEVSVIGPNYLHITEGTFFPKDVYVPRDAVARFGENAVHLNMTKDQVHRMPWSRPPAPTEYTSAMEPSSGMPRSTGPAPRESVPPPSETGYTGEHGVRYTPTEDAPGPEYHGEGEDFKDQGEHI